MSLGPAVEASHSTSHTLLQRVQRREAAAWERFAALYGPLVYGWCRRAQLSSSDAADVVQDVFTAVFASVGEFRHDRPGDTLRGWLRVICRNKLNDFFRRRAASVRARGGSNNPDLQTALDPADDDASTLLNERYGLIRRASELVRGEFEPRSWQAFWLMAVESKTAAEAASQLNMTPGAVRQAKYMVLRRLREELVDELE